MKTIKEHTHWGIWIAIIILGIIVFSNHNPFSIEKQSKNIDVNKNRVTKVVFEFDDKYFRIYNDFESLDYYNNKTIEFPPGYIEDIEYILKNNES